MGSAVSRHFVCSNMHINADSQKQYWEIKQKYRDVILFFKIGTFYELYEDDAQIGHDILGWKMTITGVGHCRQVMLALDVMLAQSLCIGAFCCCDLTMQADNATRVANQMQQPKGEMGRGGCLHVQQACRQSL